MKLSTYFNQQGWERLSDERKIALYQRICEERSRVPHSFLRTHILRKNRIYAMFIIVLVFSLFWVFFSDIPEFNEYRAFWTTRTPSWNYVSADYIAEVLEINWDYIIEKEGKTFQNSVLFDGDIITLKDSAKIIFNINDHIKTEIQWPAKFTINKVADGKYHLLLMEWDYLKIDSEESNDTLQVETDEMVVATEEDEKIALTLTKSNAKTTLVNKGSALVVTDKAEEKEITLESEKLLTMAPDDITNISDIKEFTSTLSKGWNLTYTTSISWENKEAEAPIEEITYSDLAGIISGDIFLTSNNKWTTNVNEESITNDLSYSADEKIIPTEAQLSQVTAALNSSFLLWDVKALYLAKQSWDSAAITNAYKTILWRVKAVGDACNISIAMDATASSILAQIDKAEAGMNNYYFPPTKKNQLKTLKNWISYINENELNQSWEEFSSQLPWNLKF